MTKFLNKTNIVFADYDCKRGLHTSVLHSMPNQTAPNRLFLYDIVLTIIVNLDYISFSSTLTLSLTSFLNFTGASGSGCSVASTTTHVL
jgi:hypothetical protein